MGFTKCFKILFTAIVTEKYYGQQKYWGGYSALSSPALRPTTTQKELLSQIWRVEFTANLNLLFLFLPEIWYLKPKTKLTKCLFSLNTESFILLHQSVLTSESTVFFYPYFHLNKTLGIKAVCRKNFNSPSLLFNCHSFLAAKAVNK